MILLCEWKNVHLWKGRDIKNDDEWDLKFKKICGII